MQKNTCLSCVCLVLLRQICLSLGIVFDFGFNFTLAAELVTIHIYFIDSVQDPEAQVE